MSTLPLSDLSASRTKKPLNQALLDNLYYTSGQASQSASRHDVYTALAYAIRDRLIDRWRATTDTLYEKNPKFIYYFSAEYLPGPQLTQNLLYTGLTEEARRVLAADDLADFGFDVDLDDLIELEREPGLGNGGLGRLASCFLDSLATLDIPCVGYGIRYEFGIFTQSFRNGWQVESPNDWLFYGNPWEFAQPDDMVEVRFGGRTESYVDDAGRFRVRWLHDETVMGEPYHMFAPGYQTQTVNLLRLWRARACQAFDFQLFDRGDYVQAVQEKIRTENITKVLYPNDNTPQGKELRLRQQYFFVACSLQDIIRRFHLRNDDWSHFPQKVVIQLNDTHPVIAIPELMRILLDEEHLDWATAWDITRQVFGFTNHTLLPEALEQWPVSLLQRLLPRHLEIIYEINTRFLHEVRSRFPGDTDRVRRMSIIAEGAEQQVRMAHLASIASFSINGVAELQSNLLQERVLHDFYEMWPHKFNNKTNGVTPRRFVKLANPSLSDLITRTIGDGWLIHLNELCQLEKHVEDAEFRRDWRQIKMQNKRALADHIHAQLGIRVNPDSIFDVMVKRLHEYKRQLLKLLHIITLYNRLKADPGQEFTPYTFIFGAKAAPGYFMAKRIIKLINAVAAVVNADPVIGDRLQVAFLPNFNVSLAEKIYPAADVSEQISLAGKEASGTGNMKFALNGAVTVGTLDGANIEIRERVGAENFFLFGLRVEQVFALKTQGYKPLAIYQNEAELKHVIDQIGSGYFSRGDTDVFRPIVDALLGRDEFMLLADYHEYVKCHERVAQAYRDTDTWTRMSILNTARCGFFSSDRTIRQYCDYIWHVEPVRAGGV